MAVSRVVKSLLLPVCILWGLYLVSTFLQPCQPHKKHVHRRAPGVAPFDFALHSVSLAAQTAVVVCTADTPLVQQLFAATALPTVERLLARGWLCPRWRADGAVAAQMECQRRARWCR